MTHGLGAMSDFQNLTRKELQALAKASNIKANQKTTVLITELTKLHPAVEAQPASTVVEDAEDAIDSLQEIQEPEISPCTEEQDNQDHLALGSASMCCRGPLPCVPLLSLFLPFT